jgi:hypothetical protein
LICMPFHKPSLVISNIVLPLTCELALTIRDSKDLRKISNTAHIYMV